MKRKPIAGIPGYFVYEDGRIFSEKSGKFMKPNKHPGGYRQIHLRADGRYHVRYIHRLVMEAFGGPNHEGGVVNHKNCDKTDNRFANLEWTTPMGNVRHAHANGRMPSHYQGPRFEREILKRLATNMSTADICAELGVSKDAVLNLAQKRLPRGVMKTRAAKIANQQRGRDEYGRYT